MKEHIKFELLVILAALFTVSCSFSQNSLNDLSYCFGNTISHSDRLSRLTEDEYSNCCEILITLQEQGADSALKEYFENKFDKSISTGYYELVLGDCYSWQGDSISSISAYQRSNSLGCPFAALRLARFHQNAEGLDSVKKIHGNFHALNAARVSLECEQVEIECVDELTNGIPDDYPDTELWATKGLCEMLKGNYDASKGYLLKSLDFHESAYAYFLFSKLSEADNNCAEAIKSLQQAVFFDSYYVYEKQLAWLYFKCGEREKALNQLQELYKKYNNQRSLNELITYYYVIGDRDGASELLKLSEKTFGSSFFIAALEIIVNGNGTYYELNEMYGVDGTRWMQQQMSRIMQLMEVD